MIRNLLRWLAVRFYYGYDPWMADLAMREDMRQRRQRGFGWGNEWEG